MANAKVKMIPTGASVDAYSAAIANPARRADCEALIALMSKITKAQPAMWGPGIVGFGHYHHKYASGRPEGTPPDCRLHTY